MKSPIINWTCGLMPIIGLPTGIIIAMQTGSLMKGLAGMFAIVLIGLLACRTDILKEYRKKRNDQ